MVIEVVASVVFVQLGVDGSLTHVTNAACPLLYVIVSDTILEREKKNNNNKKTCEIKTTEFFSDVESARIVRGLLGGEGKMGM